MLVMRRHLSVLGEALSKNRKLKKLYMTSMGWCDGWAALFRGISNSVSLEEINFNYNEFGDKEALSFAAGCQIHHVCWLEYTIQVAVQPVFYTRKAGLTRH